MPLEAVRLTVRGLKLRPRAPAFDETVHAGEIVGLAGLEGHGQEDFLEVLAGLRRPEAGRVLVGRDGPALTGVKQAVRQGVAYLPRDRRTTGIFPTLSVVDNFAIATLERDRRFGLISRSARGARFGRYRERLAVVAPSDRALITALSGGNQQKVLLARVLALEPRVLLLNDPTRGVDIRTRHTLYEVFTSLAAEAMALVVLSTEIEEIVRLCHRVLVFREGSVQARFDRTAMQAERVIAAMFGNLAATAEQVGRSCA
ncbi:MAG: ATP-binding cassette domain-containing protein [Acetobacteraceae bacterium]